MKTIVLSVLATLTVLLLIGASGYYYYLNSDSSFYKVTLDSEVNQSNRHFENVVGERAQTYSNATGNFHVNIGTFADKAVASREIERYIGLYNPAQINYGKYVYYDEKTSIFFYQSDNKVVLITSAPSKQAADEFIIWFTKRIKPI